MKLIRSIVTLYDEFFKNDISEVIIKQLNANEKKTFALFAEWGDQELDDSLLDRKLFNALYGKSGNREAYKSFKRQFKVKLRRIVLVSGGHNLQAHREKVALMDSFCAINKMMYLGMRDPLIKEAELLLSQSLKKLDYRIARNTCWILVHNYSNFKLEKNLRDKYDALYQELNEICDIEYKAQMIYSNALMFAISDEVNTKKVDAFISEITSLRQDSNRDSIYFNFNFYKLHLLFAKDEMYMNWCQEAIEYFSRLGVNYVQYTSIFRNRLINYYLEKKEFAKSETNLIRLLNDSKKYTNIWYRYSTSLVRVYLRIGRYEQANQWYSRLVNSRKYRNLDKSHRNNLLVIGMYVQLGMGKAAKVRLHRVRYNIIYQKHSFEDDVVSFLVAEIICLIKNGKPDVDRKLNVLRERTKGDLRCAAFCDALEFGKKFRTDQPSTFAKEMIEYEKLLKMI